MSEKIRQRSLTAVVELCKSASVAVGAHTRFPDRAGFSRQPMAMPDEAPEASCRTGGRTGTERLEKAGSTVIGGAFADRRYGSGGLLRSRKHSDSFIEDPVDAARRAVDIVCRGSVKAAGGDWLTVRAQMLCIHGDTKNAAVIAAAVRRALEAEDVQIGAFSSSHH